jgi:hypothetical protein
MTFATYYTNIAAAVFPEGEAENLVLPHKLAVKDALIDLQTKVPCLRTDHAEYVGQSATTFHCGASVFDTVDGSIERVYTLGIGVAPAAGQSATADNYQPNTCQMVEYTYVDWDRMLALLRQYKCCLPSTAYGMAPVPANFAPGATSFPAGSSQSNKGYRTSADEAYWSMHRGQIYVFPSIESTEQIVVEWSGIKRTWDDTSTMPATMVGGTSPNEYLVRDVSNAVEYYLDAEVNRRETKDVSSYQLAAGLYTSAISQLIYECRKNTGFVRQPRVMPPDAC